VNLYEQVVGLGVDDMGFGLSRSERFRTSTADQGGEGKEICIGVCPAQPWAVLGQCSALSGSAAYRDIRRSGRSIH